MERQGSENAQRRIRAQQTSAGDLTMSLVVLTAALMKADGRVTQRELDHVRRFFVQQFGAGAVACNYWWCCAMC